MKQNMGNADRIIRVMIAALIGVLYITNTVTGAFAYILLAVGAIFLLTTLQGPAHCIPYSALIPAR